MFQKHDITRNICQLFGRQATCGYDWWWHSFTAHHEATGEERAFFIEFFLCNPSLGGDEPILGQRPESRRQGLKPSYLMVKVGTWGKGAKQLHRFFGWNAADVPMTAPFHVAADDCYVDETTTRGRVCVTAEEAADAARMCEAGEMSWELSIDKQTAFHVGYGASKLFRKLQLFEMFWHAEGMKTAYSGKVTLDGETYLVTPDTCYGYADKNWGKDFTSPWVWLSSSDLISKRSGKKLSNSVFDIGGGCPKIGPFALKRKLLSAFWYEGKAYEFNFSKFWTFTRTRFESRETDTQILWHVEQKTWRHRMVTDIVCEKADMLLVNYEAPNGLKRHNRLWNGGNGRGTVKLYRGKTLIDEIACAHVGCEYGEYDAISKKE